MTRFRILLEVLSKTMNCVRSVGAASIRHSPQHLRRIRGPFSIMLAIQHVVEHGKAHALNQRFTDFRAQVARNYAASHETTEARHGIAGRARVRHGVPKDVAVFSILEAGNENCLCPIRVRPHEIGQTGCTSVTRNGPCPAWRFPDQVTDCAQSRIGFKWAGHLTQLRTGFKKCTRQVANG
ncbi:hypothetical protein J4558_20960 [Leptolyngbya sp. 15MV]|nr:hypothetical protein J4558_20960 [Leptolyngbya sp. 15MV]